MIIGLCGKSGCGKSTVASKLIEKYGDGAVHLDIDKVGHSALKDDSVKEKLVSCFGEGILNGDVVDRKRLGNIVFGSDEEMARLTDITWGYMESEIDEFLNRNCGKVIILDWQLLPKSKFLGMCDLRVLLDVPYEVRLRRAMKRDGISKEAFDLRESASIQFNPGDFDLVLSDTDKDSLKKLVMKL